jgi:hypothetical protein
LLRYVGLLKAVRKKIGKLKLLPLLSRCSQFTQLVHTFNILPLILKDDVVSTYEVILFTS